MNAASIGRSLLLGVAVFLAWAAAGISSAAEPPERITVKSIVEIDLALEKRVPPNLVVTAVGEVPSLGFSAVELNRVVYVMPPADGIQDYYLSAVPPAGPVPQVISRVTASDRWVEYERAAPWLRGVRVHGVGGGVLVKLLASEPKAPAATEPSEQDRRLHLVRQMYREVAPLVLGIREPISVTAGYVFEDGGTTILVVEDAERQAFVFHLDRRIESPTRDTLFVSVEERPNVRTRDRPRGDAVLVRGPEEAALYGLLLRWERPDDLADETRIAVDVMLARLDARFTARP